MAANLTTLAPRGRPMGPAQEQANAFVAAEMAAQPGALQRTQRGGVALVNDSNNFPAQQYPNDIAGDSDMVLRSQVVRGQNLTGNAVNVQYSLSEKDFEFYRSKQAAEEMANYERWVATQFDFTKPADVDRFAKMFPEYFERRLAVLKNVSDANLRYAQIMLTGAQSADDYLYLWMAQTGRIPLIEGPIWKPEGWFGGATVNQASMALFNPIKLFATNSASMKTPNIPAIGGNFFNPGLPSPYNAGRAAEILDGAAVAAGAPRAPQNQGVPGNFSFLPYPAPAAGGAVVANPYRAAFGL